MGGGEGHRRLDIANTDGGIGSVDDVEVADADGDNLVIVLVCNQQQKWGGKVLALIVGVGRIPGARWDASLQSLLTACWSGCKLGGRKGNSVSALGGFVKELEIKRREVDAKNGHKKKKKKDTATEFTLVRWTAAITRDGMGKRR